MVCGVIIRSGIKRAVRNALLVQLEINLNVQFDRHRNPLVLGWYEVPLFDCIDYLYLLTTAVSLTSIAGTVLPTTAAICLTCTINSSN